MSTQQKAEQDKEKRREERGKKSKKTALQGTEWATKTHRAWGSGKCSHPWNRSRTCHSRLCPSSPEVRHRAQSDGIVFLWNITDIDVSYELPVSLIQIRASSQAYLEKIWLFLDISADRRNICSDVPCVLGKCAWNSVVLCAVGAHHSGDHHHMCVRTRQVPTDTLYAVLRHPKSGLSFLNQSGMNMMALHPMTKYSV